MLVFRLLVKQYYLFVSSLLLCAEKRKRENVSDENEQPVAFRDFLKLVIVVDLKGYEND